MNYDPKSDRPFHETIVDTIRQAKVEALPDLFALIVASAIPKNHDAIIIALIYRRDDGDKSNKGLFNAVVAAVQLKMFEAARQAKIKALAAKVVDVSLNWDRVQTGCDFMFQIFTFTHAQLVHYFGEMGAQDIIDYFARVGLTHGERLDSELETKLRQMGLWRDRALFDVAFSGGNKS